jgi:hypothetical protein
LHTKCKACFRAYRTSEAGKAAQYRADHSEKGIAKRKRYRAKPETKEHAREYQRATKDAHHGYQRKFSQTEKGRETKRRQSRNYRQRHEDKCLVRTHNYNAKKRALPNTLTIEDWTFALEYWGGRCAICGEAPTFWTILSRDHWIPISDKRPDNPGTSATNILPLCFSRYEGSNCCNNSKGNRDPVEWLIGRLGKRKASRKLAEIQAYFTAVQTRKCK